MEVPDAVGAVVGRGMAFGVAGAGPAGSGGGADAERAELVERKHPVREVLQHVLHPVELGVALGVGGFLPGLGALEGDTAAGEQAP
ncbi:hypothetical protein GCM10010251_96770 [Streptomyces aurantiogriseus]|uniref:Uncharacterized protein n=1 Tax=Streptomyces aurantiogriseus TaxID=66870 RepID=A0A918FPI3_9ACTN|nr:hypothetical protein GCM10010251_96770 [Streptomyces aurantiogriseus]